MPRGSSLKCAFLQAPADPATGAPLWAQAFFLLRTGHRDECVSLVERYSVRPIIKRALRAWVSSGGMHRLGDPKLVRDLDIEYCEHVLPGNDIWQRAVYMIVNDCATAAGGEAPLNLRDVPSIYGITAARIKGLGPAHTLNTSSHGWTELYHYVQDIIWRYLVFVRPDNATPRYSMEPTVDAQGRTVVRGVQGWIIDMLSLCDGEGDGLCGMDGELDMAVMMLKPKPSIHPSTLS
jgi:hypothetical protein